MFIRSFRRVSLLVAAIAALGAIGASAASANPAFVADEYPTSVSVDPGYFYIEMDEGWYSGLTFNCKAGSESAETTLLGPRNSLSPEAPAHFLQCAWVSPYGWGTWADADMNGCDFQLLPGNETVSVGPTGCGPIKIPLKEKPKGGGGGGAYAPECFTLPSQELKASYSNAESHVNVALEAGVTTEEEEEEEEKEAPGVIYTMVECGTPGTYEDGVMTSGSPMTVSPKGAGSVAIEDVPTRLEAEGTYGESYPTELTGAGLPRLDVPATGKSLKCGSSTLDGWLNSWADHVDLDATYGECGAYEGEKKLIAATVLMNGCNYTLDVQDTGAPYSGTWGVACDEAGEAIELRILNVDCLEIPPQQGLEGVDLANTGEGVERRVTLDAEVSGLEYELFHHPLVGCPTKTKEAETFTDGVLSGESTLTGELYGIEPAGVFLAG